MFLGVLVRAMTADAFRVVVVVLEDLGVELFVFVDGFLLPDGANGVFLLVYFPQGLVANVGRVELPVVHLFFAWLPFVHDTAVV
jgi:hypothetical protein